MHSKDIFIVGVVLNFILGFVRKVMLFYRHTLVAKGIVGIEEIVAVFIATAFIDIMIAFLTKNRVE